MHTPRRSLVVVLTTALLVGVLSAAAGATPDAVRAASADSYVVTLEGGRALVPSAVTATEAAGGAVGDRWSGLVPGFEFRGSAAVAEAVARLPGVARVEPNQVLRPAAVASWGLDRIDQREKELDGRYVVPSSHTGVGTTIYVVDSGVRATHEDLAGRVRRGFGAVDDDRGTTDCNGHGTHVAATIGGSRFGVARQATIVPVRVLDCAGVGTLSEVLSGLAWVAGHATGPSVVNLSLGGSASPTIDDAVTQLAAAGLVVVAAAGNQNADACNYSPARASAVITVGASDRADRRAGFSNWGACVDLWAPGTEIASAGIAGDRDAAVLNGSSMAAAHASGVAAVALSLQPSRTPSQVASLLRSTAGKGWLSDVRGARNLLLHARLSTDGRLAPGVVAPTPADRAGIDRPAVVRGNTWELAGGVGGAEVVVSFDYGRTTDMAVFGDWDGDGVATPGLYRGGNWYLRNSNTGGRADIAFHYGGRPADFPLVGDWDGDGIDTVGVIRGGTWHLVNEFRGGEADITFTYGRVAPRGDDIPLVGDWNGDGSDTPGVVREGTWYLRNVNSGGVGQVSFVYGRVGPRGDDIAIAGDWDGDDRDTVGIVRGNDWYLRDRNAGGPADTTLTFGTDRDWKAVVGGFAETTQRRIIGPAG